MAHDEAERSPVGVRRLPEGPYQASWASLSGHAVPRWYQDGKFGIFIHWGPYCVPAFGNEWYPRNMYQPGTREYEHHVATYGPQTTFGYKDFIPRFEAEHFDADQWAELFREAGARFVVPVAEHHDGFAMYDTALSDWCAAKMGPRRDVLGELERAVRRQWLVFGLSSHRAEHWWFFDGGMRFASDVRDPRHAGLYGPAQLRDTQPNDGFLFDWLARCCEVVDRYQPELVWFDWWINQPSFQPYLQRFAAYYYNRAAAWGREVTINYKYTAYPETAAVLDVERGQLSGIRPLYWQNDTSVSRNSWGHIRDQDYKDAGTLVADLVDVVSKNGALLLNIGPKADGTIPAEEGRLLREIGNWLATNGEAIYDSRPWTVYGEGPTVVVEGAFTDTKRAAYTAQDIRFTTRGETLYAILLAWPADGVALVQSLGTTLRVWDREVDTITLLGSQEPLRWTRNAGGLRVILPEAQSTPYAHVLKIEPKGAKHDLP
jgi:alpha-L-fucosidase